MDKTTYFMTEMTQEEFQELVKKHPPQTYEFNKSGYVQHELKSDLRREYNVRKMKMLEILENAPKQKESIQAHKETLP